VKDAAPTRNPIPLLALVLLVLLLQPVAFALLVPRPEPPVPPPDLTRVADALERLADDPGGPPEAGEERLLEALSRIESALRARPPAPSVPAAPAPPPASEEHGRRRLADLAAELSAPEEERGDVSTRFLLWSMEEVLARFGRPQWSRAAGAQVVWSYRTGEGRLVQFTFSNGRVGQFHFD
jgi:hypothetical protein